MKKKLNILFVIHTNYFVQLEYVHIYVQMHHVYMYKHSYGGEEYQ